MGSERFQGARWAALIVIAAALAAILVMLVPSGIPSAAAALLVLVVPICVAVWPLVTHRLGRAAALAIGGSLGVSAAILSGFALNLLPSGLSRANWAWYVLAVSALAAATWLLAGRDWRPRLPAVATRELFLVAIGVLLMTTGYFISRVSAPFPAVTFTELSIGAAPDSAASVDVLIASHESASTDYRLEVRRDSVLVTSIDDISLDPAETWRTTIQTGSGVIEATLIRLEPFVAPYRSVSLAIGEPQEP